MGLLLFRSCLPETFHVLSDASLKCKAVILCVSLSVRDPHLFKNLLLIPHDILPANIKTPLCWIQQTHMEEMLSTAKNRESEMEEIKKQEG